MKIDVFANFKQYGLNLPEVIRMDVVKDAMRATPIFDAIVCDPPYGFRAAAKKSGSKKISQKFVPSDKVFEVSYAQT
jgi:tRNA (guanine10-N2)-methyltransferase